MNPCIAFRTIRYGILAFALLIPAVAAAWGPQGHRLVAELAWEQLTPQAQAGITPLLLGEPEPTLPGIANWADRLRASDPDLGRRSSAWHYVNIGGDQCVYEAPRDCPEGNCVVAAIPAQAALLADVSLPAATRTQALKFLVHFVGDIHQPLHAGHAEDKGGNTYQVNLDGKGSNLHQLWDSGLLGTNRLDDVQYLERLRAMPVASPTALPATGPLALRAATWAEQSCAIVVKPGFYPKDRKISDDYVRSWLPVAETQLRLGGARVAVVLNAIFDPAPPVGPLGEAPQAD
ncbi:S1/P1 nuclease [Lysobacter sp. H21R4]|uniref:S1/P1 nuclease n=1 Tax=Lysobacter sp. H21R4 TaxID=2781021 RepID=UPI0018896A4D|nr:S1/P1 nuclease [Lysobacter sp. H21R4]QOY63293.1 S1/P1 nuclease [Lysobacter sp. H21R4]